MLTTGSRLQKSGKNHFDFTEILGKVVISCRLNSEDMALNNWYIMNELYNIIKSLIKQGYYYVMN